MNIQENWERTLESLQNDLSPTVFEAWFENLKLISSDEASGILYIGTDVPFILDTINNRYLSLCREL